jgi:hypothetical protein
MRQEGSKPPNLTGIPVDFPVTVNAISYTILFYFNKLRQFFESFHRHQ